MGTDADDDDDDAPHGVPDDAPGEPFKATPARLEWLRFLREHGPRKRFTHGYAVSEHCRDAGMTDFAVRVEATGEVLAARDAVRRFGSKAEAERACAGVDPEGTHPSEWSHTLTDAGNAWLDAFEAEPKAGKRRYGRAAIERVLAGAIERAREANADGALIYGVARLAVFGSALDEGRTDYGDLDLAMELRIKRFWDEKRKRDRARGYAAALEHHRMHFPEYHPADFSAHSVRRAPDLVVFKRIKGRSPVISVHRFEELERLGCGFRVVFEADPGVVATPPPGLH